MPCNPADVLASNYGQGWQKPLDRSFEIPHKPRKGPMALERTQYERYDRKGNVDEKQTEQDLNSFKIILEKKWVEIHEKKLNDEKLAKERREKLKKKS